MLEANAGYRREQSLTSVDGEVFEEELTWGVESQIHVQPQHVAEATLTVDERRLAGSFVVETRMRGTVYVSFTCPRDNNAQVSRRWTRATRHWWIQMIMLGTGPGSCLLSGGAGSTVPAGGLGAWASAHSGKWGRLPPPPGKWMKN